MNKTTKQFFCEAVKTSAKKFKSNDRMLPRTKANVAHIVDAVHALDDKHKPEALHFLDRVGPLGLFDIMHGMRRWYTGQTMARKLLEHRESLNQVMKLDPKDAIGVYRGFKVPNDHELAKVQPGTKLTLDVTRNHGMSSWTTSQDAANKFSGGGKGKTGLIIKLVSGNGIKPVLAPPERTVEWFNKLYASAIGNSFRPKEGEYLISGPKVEVEIIRVKK